MISFYGLSDKSSHPGKVNFLSVKDLLTAPKKILFRDFFYQFYQSYGCLIIAIVRNNSKLEGPEVLVNPLRIKQLLQPEYSLYEEVNGSFSFIQMMKLLFWKEL